MSKKILLTQGKAALVDDKDYEVLSRYNWHYVSQGYAARKEKIKGKRKVVLMHRQILRATDKWVDHINGDGLDNRRENIRLVTPSQNRMNSKPLRTLGSKFKGVYRHTKTKKWCADIRFNGKTNYLGSFDLERDAAAAYNLAAKQKFGAYAKLNQI